MVEDAAIISGRSSATQARTGSIRRWARYRGIAPETVRRQPLYAGFASVLADQVPNHLFRQAPGATACRILPGRSTFRVHLAIRCALSVLSYCGRIPCMPRGNPSPKIAITIDPDIHENILAAAARDGVSVSAWMTAAARMALQRRAGLAAVARWEKQHGPFTTEEINEARRSVRAQLRTSRTVRRSA